MNMTAENDTLRWYQENAEEFIARTGNVDMTAHYRRFLHQVPTGGYILDLGCGAGSASLYFTQMGYQVLAVDGCEALCEHTHHRAGCPVRCIRFEELDFADAFDGVWACASLLHLRKAELPPVLHLIRKALKKNGVFYASFKYGDAERERNGRVFSDFTEDSLRAMLNETGGFQVIDLCTTSDARPDRADECWVNVLCRANN
ncbi:MAG: class I SAM-dependent methyltransferase [Clostridia bacterium]|nr:class I SAM-dependent methyltransferase [Clostridia bacterium]